MCTLFTNEQSDIALKKDGYWKGSISWEAYRSAEAATIDGLNSKTFISEKNKHKDKNIIN